MLADMQLAEWTSRIIDAAQSTLTYRVIVVAGDPNEQVCSSNSNFVMVASAQCITGVSFVFVH